MFSNIFNSADLNTTGLTHLQA